MNSIILKRSGREGTCNPPRIWKIVSGFRKYCCHRYLSILGEESIHVLKFWLLVWFWWVWFCLSSMKTCARVLDPISDSKSHKKHHKTSKKSSSMISPWICFMPSSSEVKPPKSTYPRGCAKKLWKNSGEICQKIFACHIAPQTNKASNDGIRWNESSSGGSLSKWLILGLGPGGLDSWDPLINPGLLRTLRLESQTTKPNQQVELFDTHTTRKQYRTNIWHLV